MPHARESDIDPSAGQSRSRPANVRPMYVRSPGTHRAFRDIPRPAGRPPKPPQSRRGRYADLDGPRPGDYGWQRPRRLAYRPPDKYIHYGGTHGSAPYRESRRSNDLDSGFWRSSVRGPDPHDRGYGAAGTRPPATVPRPSQRSSRPTTRTHQCYSALCVARTSARALLAACSAGAADPCLLASALSITCMCASSEASGLEGRTKAYSLEN